ncbi:MAG TPA: hypothetical protein VGO56_05440, partial [Pyrinomonadaceae bacterium]|nr:hypothetical protein [Pyrinomonadaceae bacterium]
PTPAWKSLAKKRPDFPTFPQLLLLDIEMAKTDTSLANKTGHFNLLITEKNKYPGYTKVMPIK